MDPSKSQTPVQKFSYFFLSFAFFFPKTLFPALFQLQTLIMKKGAVSPFYLHLACEDLRNFASFDKV